VEARINARIGGLPRELDELAAAKAWGLTPSAFTALAWMDRARILASERFLRLREAYLAKVQREEHEKDAARKGKSGKGRAAGPDPYAAFFGDAPRS